MGSGTTSHSKVLYTLSNMDTKALTHGLVVLSVSSCLVVYGVTQAGQSKTGRARDVSEETTIIIAHDMCPDDRSNRQIGMFTMYRSTYHLHG